jgi:hypothetical protein
MASVQSVEALLILLGLPARLAYRMLDYRGLEVRFRSVPIDKNPDCGVCSRTWEKEER